MVRETVRAPLAMVVPAATHFMLRVCIGRELGQNCLGLLFADLRGPQIRPDTGCIRHGSRPDTSHRPTAVQARDTGTTAHNCCCTGRYAGHGGLTDLSPGQILAGGLVVGERAHHSRSATDAAKRSRKSSHGRNPFVGQQTTV